MAAKTAEDSELHERYSRINDLSSRVRAWCTDAARCAYAGALTCWRLLCAPTRTRVRGPARCHRTRTNDSMSLRAQEGATGPWRTRSRARFLTFARVDVRPLVWVEGLSWPPNSIAATFADAKADAARPLSARTTDGAGPGSDVC